MCAGQYPLSLDRGDTVDYASMWKRKPLPSVPVRDGASSEAIKAATIDVERTKGPILPISVNDGRLRRRGYGSGRDDQAEGEAASIPV